MGVELLRKMQKERKWKGYEVAEMLGVSGSIYSLILLGKQKPTPDQMLKLAIIFKMDLNTFNLIFFDGKLPFAQPTDPIK